MFRIKTCASPGRTAAYAVTFVMAVWCHTQVTAKLNLVEPTEFIKYFQGKSFISNDCDIKLPGWFHVDAFSKTKTSFLRYEEAFENSCTVQNLFKISGNFSFPSMCDSMTLCNSTYCAEYSAQIHQFLVSIPVECIAGKVSPSSIYTGSKKTFAAFDKHFFTGTLFPGDQANPPTSFFESTKLSIGFNKTFAEKLDLVVRGSCPAEKDLYLEINGRLPHQCEDLLLCDAKYCVLVSKVASAYATIYRRYLGEQQEQSRTLPQPCSLVNNKNTSRRKRAPIPLAGGAFMETKGHTFGLLNFNIPGFRYCGPGTHVEKMDDLGGPLSELDSLCRDHDVAYLIGVNPYEADLKLVESVCKIKHPLSPLFVAVFEAKRYFEEYFGHAYTSTLYYFPEEQKSLVYILSDYSVYDRMDATPGINHGRFLEETWKQQLHKAWAGFCLSQVLPGSTQLGNGGDGINPNPQGSQQGQISPQTDTAIATSSRSGLDHPEPSSSNEGNKENTDVDEDVGYPLIPDKYGCRVVINEISTRSALNPSFIELHRLCKRSDISKRKPAQTLRGYHLLIVRVGDPSRVYMSANLDVSKLRLVDEFSQTTRRSRAQAYFVVGSEDSSPDMTFSEVPQMVQPPEGPKCLPQEPDSTFAVILLYFSNVAEHRDMQRYLDMSNLNGQPIETPVTDELRHVIYKYVQDVVLFGDPCLLEICDEFTRMIPTRPQVDPVNNFFIPIPYVSQREEAPYVSANRCSATHLPMQVDSFEEGKQTPGAVNDCQKQQIQIFDMRSKPLQSTAQKILINLHTFFQKHSGMTLEGGPAHLTAQASSLNKNTITKVLQNWRTGTIVTPGKKRARPFPVMDKIDKFNEDRIKAIIQGFYAQNRAPFVADIHQKFEEDMKEVDENGEEIQTFKCSEKTFRKILRRMGFHYGTINTRDAILMKPEIVMWRSKFLKVLKENKESENPKEIVYLDETWIDPHSRTGKAWVPKKLRNYRQRADYSFPKNKIGKGPRIIVLNAGTVNGFVHGAMDVFPVAKKDSKGDYHDNVDSAYFLEWFKSLVDELHRTTPGKEYIIVIDNAPYHGSSSIPKQRDTKQIMYDWLEDNLPLVDRQALLPIENYLKAELWDMIKEQKKLHNFFFVDQYAQTFRHRILRLPPYNCDLNPIEYVWKDVKTEIRRQNKDQNVNTITEVAKSVMLNYSPDLWKRHVEHVERLGQEYIEQDGTYEHFFEEQYEFIVPINDDDDDDDEEEVSTDYEPIPVDPSVSASSVHEVPSSMLEEEEDELLDI